VYQDLYYASAATRTNAAVPTCESGYADSFGDPRYHQLQAQFRPQNIGLTIRKKF